MLSAVVRGTYAQVPAAFHVLLFLRTPLALSFFTPLSLWKYLDQNKPLGELKGEMVILFWFVFLNTLASGSVLVYVSITFAKSTSELWF